MKSLKSGLMLLLFISNLIVLQACQDQRPGLKSPSGKFTVKFEIKEDYKSKDTGDLDDIAYIRYKISFYHGDNRVASAEYTDVYGWDETAEPEGVDEIVSEFVWSPKEDFVILPEERWASAPGSPSYKVVNLNYENDWEIGAVKMYIEGWYGSMLVFGNVKDDCHSQVEIFDGTTGEIIVAAESKSPIGYEIYAHGDDFLFINTMLDNCRMEKDEENFTSECFEYDIPSMKLTKRDCR